MLLIPRGSPCTTYVDFPSLVIGSIPSPPAPPPDQKAKRFSQMVRHLPPTSPAAASGLRVMHLGQPLEPVEGRTFEARFAWQ